MSSIPSGNNRYFFSGVTNKGKQTINEIVNARILDLEKVLKQKKLNQLVDEVKNNEKDKKKDKDEEKEKEQFSRHNKVITVGSMFATISLLYVAVLTNMNRDSPLQIKKY